MLKSRTAHLDSAWWPLQYAVLVSSLGIIFGCDLGTLFINQEYLSDFFLIGGNRSDVIIGTYILGFIFGAFIAGYVTYGSGRKTTIVSSVAVGTFAILASVVAPNFAILLCSEFVIGFSFGLYFVAASLYNNELSAPKARSIANMMVPNSIALGLIISLVTCDDIYTKPFLVFMILVIITMVLMSLSIVKIPESPRYLALTGSTDAALAVLFKLRHDMGMAARELAEINECCRGETRGIEFYLQNTTARRLLGFFCVTVFLCNAGGLFIIPYSLLDTFALELYCPRRNVCYFTINVALVYTSFTLIFLSFMAHSFAIWRFSRRKSVLMSFTIACLFLAAAYVVALLGGTDIYHTITTICLVGYSIFGLGAYALLINVVICELLPIRGREFGLAAIILSHSIAILFDLQGYMPIIHKFDFATFLGFGVLISCCALGLIYFYLPNTDKTQSLEGIELRVMSAPSFTSLGTFNFVNNHNHYQR